MTHCKTECYACNNGLPHKAESGTIPHRESALLIQLRAVNLAMESVYDTAYYDEPYKNRQRRKKLLDISQEIQEELITIAEENEKRIMGK